MVFGKLKFLPLVEGDLPTLQSWLMLPHLQQWWNAETDCIDKLREGHLPSNPQADSAVPFLVCIDHEPVGYIQYYDASQGTPNWWPDNPGPGVFGIDQFIADPNKLGKGLGTAMVSQIVDKLFSNPMVQEIRVDPHPDNHRAIRCYGKVGFETVGRIFTPDGPAVMMVMKRKLLG